MSLADLTAKNAVVTGGARGIGRAIVQTLAECGADVMIADFRFDEADATAREIARSTGRRVMACATDVTRLEQVQAMRSSCMGRAQSLGMASSTWPTCMETGTPSSTHLA